MNVFHKHLYSDLVPSACVIFILKDQILIKKKTRIIN